MTEIWPVYFYVWNIQSGLQPPFDAYLLVPYQLLCLSHVDEDVALKSVQNYVVNFYHFLFTVVQYVIIGPIGDGRTSFLVMSHVSACEGVMAE
jgi:hypothetical protein